jgi:hypothetical protein
MDYLMLYVKLKNYFFAERKRKTFKFVLLDKRSSLPSANKKKKTVSKDVVCRVKINALGKRAPLLSVFWRH